MRIDLCQLLSKGKFTARKWGSNDPSLLFDVDPTDHGLAWNQGEPGSAELHLLGLLWHPLEDSFTFQVTISPLENVTKRTVLSLTAKLFDPLGWISPIIVRAKIFIQRLWRQQVDWDEPLAQELVNEWTQIHEDLPNLSKVTIARWTGQQPQVLCSLQGFADASSTTYAAVIYIRCEHPDGSITVTLLASKTRVAPLKTQTIPHLELCGCLILTQLLATILAIPEYADLTCQCWTDSTIALSWVRGDPSIRKVFVANRVAKIQALLPTAAWRHVPTHDNPADIASRGSSAVELNGSSLWWHGPKWLSHVQTDWPTDTECKPDVKNCEEPVHLQTPSDVLEHSRENPVLDKLGAKYSSWPKLMRITVYVMRFLPSRCKKLSHPLPVCPLFSELAHAELLWVQYVHHCTLFDVITNLKNGQPLCPTHKVASLDPFIDDSGIIRVGARLANSKFAFAVKHRMLATDHPLVRLFIMYAHQLCLHGGLQLTLSTVRKKFWIVRARQLARSVIFKCVSCARFRKQPITQLMGALPPARVCQPEKAFQHCGLDYAGPLSVRESKGRGKHAHSAYICLFICMSIRAIHLELVMDYSTSAFIAAFRRFVSRRGIPQTIYCDQSTNFKGARSELQEMFDSALQSPNFQKLLFEQGISWKFNPPAAPHFGGLWEAGVRSVKHHLRRILGNHTPTIEELTTLLCQIEACLNSRPLLPLTDNLDDLSALTPGHFLVGGDIKALLEPTVLQISPNRLSRWKLWQQLLETFWKRWSSDYVTSLQQRSKWRFRTEPPRIGKLVLLRDNNMPPTRWQLGRIVKCHPGADQLIRVVSVRTATTTLIRPLAKLALLPLCHEDNSDDQQPPTHVRSTACTN